MNIPFIKKMAMALSIMREVVASLKLDVSRPLTLVSIKWNELNNKFIGT